MIRFTKIWAAAAFFLLLRGSLLYSAEIKARWVSPLENPATAFVEVVGVKNNHKAEEVLRVYLQSGDMVKDLEALPMAGTYKFTSGKLTFTPHFPLYSGASYRAVIKTGTTSLSLPYSVPKTVSQHPTEVSAIYPTTNTLPENLLKFYVYFSASMNGGQIYDHIQLKDSGGNLVELPFLEIDEELWDPQMTRLTLFIDPGRIKRGVKPLEDIGPSLQEGGTYSLVISSAWRDANNQRLKNDFIKTFKVGPPLRQPIDPATWKISQPAPGSKEPLRLEFLWPMDHAIVLRKFGIIRNSKSLPGNVSLDKHETCWLFTPEVPWQPGSYQISFEQFIEDISGNNIGKAFEVDVFEKVDARFTNRPMYLPFAIH